VNGNRNEVLRIATTMTVVCALAGALLGAAFVATHRYREVADRRTERRAILDLLQLDTSATVIEIRQLLSPGRREVVYRTAPLGGSAEREIVFGLDGRLVAAGPVAAPAGGRAQRAGAPAASRVDDLVPLGRMFAASRLGVPAGFVVEGESRGYKNRIRFFVALSPAFDIAGVRVVEHEEDPGLGAEVATPAFQGQYLGRAAADLEALAVTKDPMPEDWRAALATFGRTPATAWRERHAAILARERLKPIYAVTGATISSRALTDGVRETVDHFRRRWELLAPQLRGPS
jgi:H+/Na+-translocating ferredoxin:NAD+ oxidoreductase subunit G